MNTNSRFSINKKRALHIFKYGKYNNIYFYLMIIIVIIISAFIIFLNIINNSLLPIILTLAESNVESRLNVVTNEKINIALRETELGSLINLQQNKDEKVTALEANIIKMNQLSLKIADDIEKDLNQREPIYIKVALGNIFNNSFFANRGPEVTIKVLVYGSVNTEFKTEFETAGINQTRHKIYLSVDTSAFITLPLMKKSFNINVKVPVSETVIIGDVPESFVELEGLEK